MTTLCMQSCLRHGVACHRLGWPEAWAVGGLANADKAVPIKPVHGPSSDLQRCSGGRGAVAGGGKGSCSARQDEGALQEQMMISDVGRL